MDIASISTSSIATYDLAKTIQLAGGVAPTQDAGRQGANKGKVLLEEDKAKQLSEADAALVAKLQARDRAVRQHEMAHLAVSGGLATSGASFTYQKGPDGVDYAVGGEVSIDTSPGRTPEDTIARARQIQAAALAPADPSGQDRAVASQAAQMEIAARAQLAAQSGADVSKVTAGNSDSNAREQAIKVQRAYSEPATESLISIYV
ncbi:putative metalloprotease CJM1_0395 family protein [Undibacterium sp.]|uniref:putative metalloprotease CJM1_0395 family protein n=1 Tax=Undibacterium sp. TaxID=1914977 RepID=UPI0037529896